MEITVLVGKDVMQKHLAKESCKQHLTDARRISFEDGAARLPRKPLRAACVASMVQQGMCVGGNRSFDWFEHSWMFTLCEWWQCHFSFLSL